MVYATVCESEHDKNWELFRPKLASFKSTLHNIHIDIASDSK
jgi:hypothetical protein